MMFDTTIARLGMNERDQDRENDGDGPSPFRRPPKPTAQLSLF